MNNNSLMTEENNSVGTESEAVRNETSEKKKRMTRAERKQARREKKARWKEKKKTRRAELKDFYRDAPWIVRFSRLYLIRVLAAVCVVGVCAFGVIKLIEYWPFLKAGIKLYTASDSVSEEDIHKLSPIDEEGSAVIEALPAGEADDTWAVYVYMVGSDLEDDNESSLSDLVRMASKKQREEQTELNTQKYMTLLENYLDVLDKNGLEPPMFLYEPKDYVPPEENAVMEASQGASDNDRVGAGSADISEMYINDKSGKLKVVIQTGGARKWTYPLVNPNRTQRFLISDGNITEEENLPLRRSSDPETLADFLSYCKEKHPADHTVLVLWDHGGGVFGYGSDKIYGGMLSIADVRTALSKVYTPDPDSPPFDIIGYDACLMASLDVMHTLEGFSEYYVMSEETEPHDGWDYTPWLTLISEHPETNPAQLAKKIVDSYTDYYMTENVKYEGTILGCNDITMSLIDAKKGEELYDAYCELAKKQLIDSADDISVLAEIGRAGGSSTCYAEQNYNIQNTIDLGNYLANLRSRYPEECAEMSRLLEETVIYHRENGSLSDSTGVSIYHPSFINTYLGTLTMLEYVFDICEDENVKALYFYKTAGCLTDDMKAYVRSMTDREPETLNTEGFNEFTKTEPVIDGTKFTVAVAPEIRNMITSQFILQASLSEDMSELIYYGMDELAETDSEGNITSGQYNGKWIFLDDQPLSPEIVSSSASAVEYRAKVLKDGSPVFLMFSCDRETGKFTINGTKPYTSEDTEYEFINMRVNCESIADSKIVPIYEALDSSANVFEMEGKAVRCTDKTEITRKPMDDGNYLVAAVLTDQRGDSYASDMLVSEISHGRIVKFSESDEYFDDMSEEE